MKRILASVLAVILFMSGCSALGGHIKESVTFHYLCSHYREDMCCVIASEEREASGHIGDLSYLLALYLMGPTSDELTSPLPVGIHILTVQQQEGSIVLELSDTGELLSDIEFSLAGACLTMTCLSIAEADNVTVTSGSRTITMNAESISLFDGIAESVHEEVLE